MVTTTDNPFDPFTEYRSWLTWDHTHGYNTIGLLARCTIDSEELSEADQDVAIRQAMMDIVTFNASGMHVLVKREVPDRD